MMLCSAPVSLHMQYRSCHCDLGNVTSLSVSILQSISLKIKVEFNIGKCLDYKMEAEKGCIYFATCFEEWSGDEKKLVCKEGFGSNVTSVIYRLHCTFYCTSSLQKLVSVIPLSPRISPLATSRYCSAMPDNVLNQIYLKVVQFTVMLIVKQ